MWGFGKRIGRIFTVIGWSLINLQNAFRALRSAMFSQRAYRYSHDWKNNGSVPATEQSPNPLRTYFNSYTSGNGIWKWDHYFDIYHTHFNKFIGREVHIVEVGVYSGGSLDMWRHYFGDKCKVYGVDIQPECKSYEKEGVSIFIGDQADPEFWKKFVKQVPKIDILIDDGGHQTEQQIVTLEEVLPFISPGGIYVCEDIHGSSNNFADYVAGLQKTLNHQHFIKSDAMTSVTNRFQKNIISIHNYPFSVVIQKGEEDMLKYFAPKKGTKWEPFL